VQEARDPLRPLCRCDIDIIDFNCLESGEHFISVQRAAVVSSRSDEYRARAAECLERAQEARDFEVKRTADVGSRRLGSILVSREIRVTG
jgi:hypothetical protein